MKLSPRLLMASPSAAGTGKAFRPAPMALLPPIPLYRRLFRAHRKHLTREMRLLGDEYIKSEFRQHREVENPVHIIGFLTEWQMYAQKLEGESWIGERMDKEKIDKMSDQQLGQLYELMQAIRKKQVEESGEENPGPEQL
ncbi:Succinate dehydrogenase assembly factor 3,<br_mitochondrial [Botrytis cinerea]